MVDTDDTIRNCNFTDEEKKLVAFAISRFGTDEHPAAIWDNQSFGYFRVGYARECLEKYNNSGNATDEGLQLLWKVMEKVYALEDRQ